MHENPDKHTSQCNSVITTSNKIHNIQTYHQTSIHVVKKDIDPTEYQPEVE
jgi:hypothetical protein